MMLHFRLWLQIKSHWTARRSFRYGENKLETKRLCKLHRKRDMECPRRLGGTGSTSLLFVKLCITDHE
jgi:hypothetical protein